MTTLIGVTLGPYRILEQIGLGGMATVYKAYQPGMDRLVALKVLPQHYARDPRFTKRFEQEARVIAKLEYRNIVPVYDFGEQDGTAYLAMRYLQAGTVKEILSHGPLPLPDAAKLISDIASALDYAHSQGIIHRDVKPSNVLVDKQGNAYLTDFGIAKVIESTMEMTGSAALGTPAYMAPEQTLGKAVTPQSDVYSLGVMLYEMVTGKPPFEADTPMAIALMHVHEPLPLPRKVKSDLPEAVELVILKALAKDPSDRYESAGELAKAFREVVGPDISTAPGRLVELASVAADDKGSEEVTYDIRAEIKRRDNTERRTRWMKRLPYVFGTLLLIAGAGIVSLMASQAANPDGQYSGTLTEAAQVAVALTNNALSPKTTSASPATADLAGTVEALIRQTQTQQAAQLTAIVMTPSPRLIVNLVDENDRPITMATVTVKCGEAEIGSSDVDENGRTVIESEAARNCQSATVLVIAQGYVATAAEIGNLMSGDNDISISLKRDPYGLLPAEACSEGETLLFVDDFQLGTLDKWSGHKENWAIEEENGNFNVVRNRATLVNNTNAIIYSQSGFQNAHVKFRFKIGGNAEQTSTLNVQLHGSPSGTYYVGYPVYANFGGIQLLIDNRSPGPNQNASININWHTIEITFLDGQITIYLDGIQTLAYLDKTPTVTGVFALLSSRFDDVVICGLQDSQTSVAVASTTPKPTLPANFTPAPTARPTPFTTIVDISDGSCKPNSVFTGTVIIRYGVGRWGSPEETISTTQNSVSFLTINGQDLPGSFTGFDPPKELSPGVWDRYVYHMVTLEPGTYNLQTSMTDANGGTHGWSCALTVVEP